MPHDLKLWCEDCQKGYEGECEEHGPLTHVCDTEVGTKARRSLPNILELKEGKIRTGVFAKEKLAKRLQFGPLQGISEREPVKQLEAEEEIRKRYGIVYKLVQDNEDLYVLDTRFESQSNWMIFVRPAEKKSEQNLVAFQYKGDIFFATIKEVPAHSELKVWFSRDYAEKMGARILSDDGSSWQFRTRQRFSCLGCGVVFSNSASLANHQCSKSKQKIKSEGFPSRKRAKRSVQETPSTLVTTGSSAVEIVLHPVSEESVKTAPEAVPKEEHIPELRFKEKSQILKSSDSSESEEEPKTPTKGIYQCLVCEKIFHSPGKLKQHSYSHTGEKPFSCSHCQKAFSSRFKLGRHQLIHTGERQHRCHLCNRSFHRKDHLKNHLQIHDPNKQFKCERPDCGKEYNSYMSYRKHCAVHAAEEGDLECKICLEMFDNKTDLIYHLKVHVGTRTVKSPSEKKFQCDQCDRRFFTRKDVKRHMVVHTGKRDFLCSLCPQKFGRKDHLVRHIKKSHGVSDPSRLDPLSIPGPSSAPQAQSPETAGLSSTSASSGDQSFSSLLLGEPLPASSKPYPQTVQEPPFSAGAFQSEFRFFEEGIKEEPELTASMESIGAGGDDLSKILGMYLPTGSINLPVPSLLETGSSQESTVSHESGSLEPIHIGQSESLPPLLIRGDPLFEGEEPGLPPHLIPISSSEEFSQVCQIPVEGLIEPTSGAPRVQVPVVPSDTMLTRGFRGLLEEEVVPSISETSQRSSATTTTVASSTLTTTTTATVTTTTTMTSGSGISSLPGFDQAFP